MKAPTLEPWRKLFPPFSLFGPLYTTQAIVAAAAVVGQPAAAAAAGWDAAAAAPLWHPMSQRRPAGGRAHTQPQLELLTQPLSADPHKRPACRQPGYTS